MSVAGDVYQVEVKEENAGNPTIDDCVRLDVGIVQHSFDILCIGFYGELGQSD